MPDGEVLARARRSSPTAAPSAGTSTSTSNACFQTEVTEMRWDEDERALDRLHQPRRRACGPASWCMANGPLHRPKLPGIPGIETLQGPHVPHQPLGLRLHRRRPRRRPRPAWPASASASSAPAPPRCSACRTSARRRAALRLPAHAVVDRRARQPPDRSGVGREPRARLAAAADGQLQHPRLRRLPGARTWSTTAGPTSSATCCSCARKPDAGDDPRRASPSTMELADFEKMEQIRARVDAIVAGPGHRRGAEALVPPVLQAAVLPRRVSRRPSTAPTSRWSTRRAGASSGSPSTASWSTGREYELDCLIYATGFEVGTDYTRRAGYELHRPRRRDADRQVGRRRRDPPRHSTAAAFPNCFIVSLAQSGFTVNFPHMLNEQAKHVAYILEHASRPRCDARRDEPKRPRTTGCRPSSTCRRCSQKFLESCTPGYYNNEGRPAERSRRNGSYGAGRRPS